MDGLFLVAQPHIGTVFLQFPIDVLKKADIETVEIRLFRVILRALDAFPHFHAGMVANLAFKARPEHTPTRPRVRSSQRGT